MPKGYEYRINGGTPVDAGDVLSIPVTGLSPNTSYDFEVRKRDNDGNYSAWSPIYTISTLAASGGPVTLALLSNQQRTTASAADYVTTGVTPSGGKRLLVIAMASDSGDSNSPMDVEMTMTDSQGLSWNIVGDESIATQFNLIGVKAWLSTTDASATSTTFTFDATTYSVYWAVCIIEVDGTDNTIAGLITDSTAPVDGAYTVTLGATPNADDAAVFVRVLRSDHNSGTGALDMGAGWTELRNDPGNGIYTGKMGVFYNDNTTSTTVTIDDTAVSDAYAGAAVDMAFIIKAG